MTYPIFLALAWAAGHWLTEIGGGTRDAIERAGLSMLLGFMLLSALMFVTGLAGLPIRPVVYLPLLAPAAVMGFRALARTRPPGVALRPAGGAPAYLIVALVVGLLLVVTARSLVLPNRLYDSITSFDLLGKAIAAEHVFRVTLFDYTRIARGGSYPPFTALTFAWGYQSGLSSAPAMMVVPFLSFSAWTFGFARRTLGATSAWVLLALCLVSPDFYSFLHLPLTQFGVAAFAAIALAHLYSAFARAGEGSGVDLRLSALAITGVVWVRADAAAFVVGLWLVVLALGRGLAPLRARILYGVPAVLVALGWQLYAASALGGSGTERFTGELFWDPDRLMYLLRSSLLFSLETTTIGLAGYGFVAGVLSLVVFRSSAVSPRAIAALAAATFLSLVIYTMLFYQVDPTKQDPLPDLLRSSYRRGLTAYVLPMWLVLFVSPLGVWIRTSLSRWTAGTSAA